METLVENVISIRLRNEENENHYFISKKGEELINQLPIVVIFNSSENLILTDNNDFDYRSDF